MVGPTVAEILEIFTLVSGLVYVWLQVKQSNWMWFVDVLCCAAAAVPNLVPTMLAIIGMLASLRKPTTDRKDGTTL